MEPSYPMDEPTQSLFPPVDSDRPPYSYKELIIKAFELVKSKPLELRDIYFLISGIFPYYKPGGAWQSAVRHVLFSDPMFITDPRTNLWRIVSNFESQNLQILPSQLTPNAFNSKNQYSYSASSLAIGNSVSSTIGTNFPYYSSSEDNRHLPISQNSSVHTVSSYTTSQPRMSSFETSNSWIDGYTGSSLQEVTRWPGSNMNYRSNFCEGLLSQHTLSRETNRNHIFSNEHISGHLRPVKPNVIRSFLGPNYNTLNPFTPLPSYPVNKNLNTLQGRSFDDQRLVKTNATLNRQNEGAFNLYRAENNLSDRKSSEIMNEESHLNTLSNFRSPKDFGSMSPSNVDFFSNPQNSYPNVFSDSFCPNGYFDTPKLVPYNQISNQLISVNIHAPQCSHQTQNYPSFDSSTSSDSMQTISNVSGTRVTDASFTNHDVTNIITPKNTVNSSFQHIPSNAQRYANAHCADNICNANVNIESPTLNDLIGSLSALSSSVNPLHNTLESAGLGNSRREMNWETSLININIHLPTLQNADVVSVERSKDKQVCDTQLGNVPSNTNNEPSNAVPNIAYQDLETDFTCLYSSVTDECSHKDTSALNSVTETNSDVNGLTTGLIVNKPSSDDTCSTSAKEDSGEPHIEMDKPGIVLAKSEENILSVKLTSCTESDYNTNCVDDRLNITKETLNENSNFSSELSTPKVPDESASFSYPEPIESSIDNSMDCSETRSRSETETSFSTKSLLIPETSLSETQSKPSDSNDVSSTKDSTAFSSTCDNSSTNVKKIINPLNNEESTRDCEQISCDIVFKNKVKQCHVALERIKFPVANLISNYELVKENVFKNDLGNTSPKNQQECEDLTNMANLPGQNSSSVGEGLGSSLNDSNQTPNYSGKLTHIRCSNRCFGVCTGVRQKSMPQEVNGFTKPPHNYCRLITQALATIPERKATADQICDVIAKKHPYYAHLTEFNWPGSIHSALRTRKKFFIIVGTDEKNEIVWTFNQRFEKFMLDKWVPKVLSKKLAPKKSLSATIQNFIPWLPKGHPQQPPLASQCSVMNKNTSTTTPAGCPSPVIVYSGSLVSMNPSSTTVVDCNSSSNPNPSEGVDEDPLRPEAPTDLNYVKQMNRSEPSNLVIQSVSSVAGDFDPWEPEITVNEDTTNNQSQHPENVVAIPPPDSEQQGTKMPTTIHQVQNPSNQDFSLDNLNVKHTILKEEITYRVNFNQKHSSVENFRLHCTVCDDHLGTSGTACRRRVRLHSILGVLVCSKCYEATCTPAFNACLWCARRDPFSVHVFSCINCASLLCQSCLERNFGRSWCATLLGRRDWKCFRCDTQQIWPHRAVAYFLFRHYREMKRKKDQMTKYRPVTPRELRFFIQDLSTCCKPSVGTRETQPMATATLPNSGAPEAPVVSNPALVSISTTSAPNPPPLVVIGEQSPNYIYVQTPSSVPSVTLNTGTQYIHNVYPDKNYVVVDQENRPVSTVNTPLANTIIYSQPLSTATSFPVTITTQPTNKNPSLDPMDKPPPYSLHSFPPPPYSAVEVSPVRGLPIEAVIEPVSNTFLKTNDGQIASKGKLNNSLDLIVTSTSEVIRSVEPGEPIIIPDVNPPDVSVREEKVVALPVLSVRERIERRPMPKSKKQSLLRTVLMNESIESMKRQIQLQPEHNIPNTDSKTSVPSTVSKAGYEADQNMEEPILKSIIETATERLLSLQRNQNVSSNSSNSIKETRSVTNVNSSSEMCIDLCEEEDSSTQAVCKIKEPPVDIPKIKIKTLKELQDPEVFKDDHNSQETVSTFANEKGVNKYSDFTNEKGGVENQGLIKLNVAEGAEINITDLKQGIIEASRTLINTQKQFKDLAKIISSNLIYSPNKAIELITKFHEILKTCHQELDQIDSNVKQQFAYLIPTTSIDSLLPGENLVPKKKTKMKKKRGRKKFLGQEQQNIEENQTDPLINHTETATTNVHSSMKRKRDLLDFNPLGKKVILGSPDVTEEDLQRIQENKVPSCNQVFMEELRRRQFLAKRVAWKKKNIWLTTRRKKRKYTEHYSQRKVLLRYNEDGTLMKKRPYKRRNKISTSDDDDETYRPTNSYLMLRPVRRRSSESSRPVRQSARCHPSTVAHVAQLMSVKQRGITHIIRPCTVVLERLDPNMVRILERNVVSQPNIPVRLNLSLSDSDEME